MSEELGNSRLEALGLKATYAYLILLAGGIPVAGYFDLVHFNPLSLNELGDFLAGAFGPLAIFWLVLGFFQQGRELQNSVEALRIQAEELKNSVEQQKAMVGITEKQLDLDIEVREEQNLLAISKELPFLQIQSAGGRSASDGYIAKFILRNIGADATNISLSLVDESTKVNPGTVQFLGSKQEVHFTIKFGDRGYQTDKMGAVLRIVMENFRQKERLQSFRVGNFPATLISCDPAQL